jgi:hypothetical protein
MLATLRGEVHRSLGWATEVPLPIPGDPRAWDAVIRGPDWRFGVEAEGLPRDAQALQRRINLKRRDDDVDGVLLVLRDTRLTRQFLRAEADVLFPDFPVPGWRALRSLREGTSPGGSSIVLIRVSNDR